MSNSHQPVHISGRLDPGLSRWTWLVKWFLLIPHLIVLAVLWIALVVLSIVALVAVVVSGRYPSALFGFNAGVLRWSWRVAFYGYALGGTDRYPPFTLSDVPDYPARLDIERPERLSRPKALVKWWLLAIPHYLVVVLLVGAGRWEAPGTNVTTGVFGLGLIGVLVLIALVALLFTGRYPAGIFDAVMGMNRWVLRVAAYALLMTDVYPPFRLDQGGDDPPAVDDDRTGRRAAAGAERRSGGPLTPAASSAPGGATIVMDPPVDVVEVPDDVPPGARRPVSTTPAPPPSTARALLLVLGSVVTALGVLLGDWGPRAWSPTGSRATAEASSPPASARRRQPASHCGPTRCRSTRTGPTRRPGSSARSRCGRRRTGEVTCSSGSVRRPTCRATSPGRRRVCGGPARSTDAGSRPGLTRSRVARRSHRRANSRSGSRGRPGPGRRRCRGHPCRVTGPRW
ncbi:DUF4389 domain-containing protein [Pseudonocardia benzenivorans]